MLATKLKVTETNFATKIVWCNFGVELKVLLIIQFLNYTGGPQIWNVYSLSLAVILITIKNLKQCIAVRHLLLVSISGQFSAALWILYTEGSIIVQYIRKYDFFFQNEPVYAKVYRVTATVCLCFFEAKFEVCQSEAGVFAIFLISFKLLKNR